MIPLRVQEAAYRAGLPALDLVHAAAAPPVGPVVGRPVRGQRLTAGDVADLVGRFARRAAPVSRWVQVEARRLDVSPSTVRRAVYRFGTYAAEGGAR